MTSGEVDGDTVVHRGRHSGQRHVEVIELPELDEGRCRVDALRHVDRERGRLVGRDEQRGAVVGTRSKPRELERHTAVRRHQLGVGLASEGQLHRVVVGVRVEHSDLSGRRVTRRHARHRRNVHSRRIVSHRLLGNVADDLGIDVGLCLRHRCRRCVALQRVLEVNEQLTTRALHLGVELGLAPAPHLGDSLGRGIGSRLSARRGTGTRTGRQCCGDSARGLGSGACHSLRPQLLSLNNLVATLENLRLLDRRRLPFDNVAALDDAPDLAVKADLDAARGGDLLDPVAVSGRVVVVVDVGGPSRNHLA